ncbi:MAG TPA: hypothetical protein VGY53_07950, partial [Isosphaeraceae bacterium]|nr:hypothetical protein [Isosphaeraceae bacterium]
VQEARVGGRAAVRGAEGTSARAAGRLFTREADEGLEVVARRYEDLARLGRTVDEPGEALLEAQFRKLVRSEPEMARTFKALPRAEKRLVVAMGETAQRLARRYPGNAETMIRKLGTEGMGAVRVYGDDVAEVIVKEGPESISVLRKTGRAGWNFFTGTVLPNKKKLIAAGVLAAFLANPDQFIDSAGRVTEYATRQFARAGIQLAGAMSSGASKALADALNSQGIPIGAARYLGMGLALGVAALALLVLVGVPLKWLFRPVSWVFALVARKRSPARAA